MSSRHPYIVLFIVLSLMASNLFAQSDTLGSVRGSVLADSTASPLEFVNVLLKKKVDSSFVRGTATDAAGIFELKDVPWGEYVLAFNVIGYQAKTSAAFVIDPEHRHLNLGAVVLVSGSVNLEEVTVASDRAPFLTTIDRMVYNVDQDISTKAASASELLDNIPSVQVDLNGEVSLRGSTRVLLMINGKRSPILERQEGTFLEQLPANTIEKIEVITTPSARYRAEGKSGIINIILKKDTPLGIHGNLTAHISNDERYNGNVRVNYSPGSFNVYGSYSIRRNNRNRVNSDVRNEATQADPTVVSSIYSDTLYSFSNPLTNMITLGCDVRIDSLNSFGVSGSYFRNTFTRRDNSFRLLKNTSGAVLSDYVRNDSGSEVDDEYSVTLNYHHNFNRKDHKLRFEIAASRSPETDEYRFVNTYESPTFPTTYDNSLIGQRDDRSHLTIDYSNVLSKTSTIEAGYTGELNRTDLNYYAENYEFTLNRFVPDPVKTSRYRFDESVHSLYTTYKQSFGKFGVLGGFRIERESGTSDLQKLDSTITNNYWNIFPSVHVSYMLSKSSEVKLSYSRRISRPKARDLNPFAEYRDPKNISYGNPLLVPEYIHSLELAYQFQSGRTYLQPSVFYRHSSNDISPIKQIVNRSTLQTIKRNVASEESAGVELICSFRAGDVLSSRVTTTALYDQLDATNVGNGKYRSNVSWSGTLTANVNVAKDTRFEFHTHWNSLRLTPQGERFPNAVLNVGIRQGLLGGKLSLTATLSDVFNSMKRHEELVISRLQQSVFNTRDSRVLFVGFTFRFGTVPKKIKEEDFRYDDDE